MTPHSSTCEPQAMWTTDTQLEFTVTTLVIRLPFKYGVARSDAAADRQQRTGHYRPAVKPKVYRVNNESDADNDERHREVTANPR